ncbi:hypothetical protein LTR78_004301 [Recurvomyces mirabilis]|uniref:Uncharacterized protein n=1 Tax=Recurvomyces mirabilis TaxID=574656 RepID=A0AAE0WPM9_9PEZI|nr:hypothetical protein LTR78_004301 [Recurvomyces mirabilis]KAK5156032.1 hypothetical protein LTS14_005598 [Recurvomyces mirabilis]
MAASVEVQTCSALWQDYLASAFSVYRGQDLGSAWTTSLATVTPTVTGTETIYTTFSPASDVFTIGLGFGASKPITYTPVYALGDPAVNTYTSIDTINAYTLTEILGPTPTCKFTRVTSDGPPSTDCGRCTLVGGTVELFYWPTATNNYTSQNKSPATATSTPLSTILNGTTLLSPTAYISFQTAYATNSCSRVGIAHTGAIIGLPPSEVSTLVHWGGKAAASGANQYGPLDYADLTGLPPASVYESQQSCQIGGCRTIYPTLQPTLVVPNQMRALDQAWQDCGLGLEGLYDPPIALTPQPVLAMPTVPASPGNFRCIAGASTDKKHYLRIDHIVELGKHTGV